MSNGGSDEQLPGETTAAAATAAVSVTEREHQQCIRAGLAIVYGDHFSSETMATFTAASDSHQLYIVGCLLLTITASVNPAYTRFERRRLQQANNSCSPPPSAADAAAAAGLYRCAAGQFRCFHCNAQVAPAADETRSRHQWSWWWRRHRSVSPACYFVRLGDFLRGAGAGDSDGDGGGPSRASVEADAERYRRALRKLRRDLDESAALQLAAEFGYSTGRVAFAATRHFMRNGGVVPARAGDMIACLHHCEEAFEQAVTDAMDVRVALSRLARLDQQQPTPQHPRPHPHLHQQQCTTAELAILRGSNYAANGNSQLLLTAGTNVGSDGALAATGQTRGQTNSVLSVLHGLYSHVPTSGR